MEDSETSGVKQDKRHLFQKGQSGNPAGRPVGSKGLKTYAKEYLASLTDDERLAFMDGIPKLDIWKMAEGNPQSDVTSAGEKITITSLTFDEYSNPVQPEVGKDQG